MLFSSITQRYSGYTQLCSPCRTLWLSQCLLNAVILWSIPWGARVMRTKIKGEPCASSEVSSVSSVSWLCPRGRSPSSVSDLLCIPWNKNVWRHCSEVIVCQASDFKRSKLLRTLRTAKQETFLVPFLPWAPSGWVSLSTVQSLYCRMAT